VYGNGDLSEEWQKQKLMRYLIDHTFAVFEHITKTNDIDLLKDLLFKVAECNKPYYEKAKRAHITSYSNHEQFEHSSIFVEKHLLHAGDAKYEDIYGTVSATLLLKTKTNVAYLFERIYDHSRVRTPSIREE
jgi:hypothetical protein